MAGYVQARTLEEWEKAISTYRVVVVYVLRTVREKAVTVVTEGENESVSESRLVENLNRKGKLPTVVFLTQQPHPGCFAGFQSQ